MENRELMLLGLRLFLDFTTLLTPQTTGGRFCFRHNVGAGLNAGHNCAGCFAGLFHAEKLNFVKYDKNGF